ncbi:DUF4097 family beta strand repeat-containing protein [Streptomyces chilikensis]|uniref:DUF4097 family beta strand repeat-containing protein n=1 Tax=Streptomyces chilikensis TaxID=1194079 RepID=UPI000B26AC9B|nr:DUF4097 family beta strand repeat-containing protein [Streptomyces chilikensis]
MHTFATTTKTTVVLDIPAGRVRLVASDRADATVEVLPADAARNRDVRAAERIEAAFEGDTLRIGAGEPESRLTGHSGAVEVTVRLPAGSRVEAKASDVEFHGTGRLGDVSVEVARGTVELEESAAARVTVLAGDVSIDRLGGDAAISTRKGDIDITEALGGTVTLRTEAGGIRIGAARGVSATLDAGTGSGRIDNALRNADGAAAGLRIHATTGHGDISARSL